MTSGRDAVAERVVAAVVVKQARSFVNEIAEERQPGRRQAKTLGFECHSFVPFV